MQKYKDVYEEHETIGRGSYGSAHKVRHKVEQQLYVAKKIILKSMQQSDQDAAQREVRLLQKLIHPHIVMYKESFNDDGTLVIIMEYCEEGDLSFHVNRKLQKQEQFPEKVILNWFVQCALALKYIHEQKILHRDIKSQNIFLTKSGFVKIGDFGISRVLENTCDQAHTVIGTPYYMSPEVCENKPYTYKSDVWALGCVLYELCNLQHAFKSNNLLGLVNKIVKDQVDAIPKNYSKSLNDLVQQLLQKRVEQRPQVAEILTFPLIRQTLDEFIRADGNVSGGSQFQQNSVMQNTNSQDYGNTVKSEIVQTMTREQRLQKKREEQIYLDNLRLKEGRDLNKQNQAIVQQKKQQQYQGSSYQVDSLQDKQQKLQYHKDLERQLQLKQNQSQMNTNFNQQVPALVQDYEKKSQILQNQSKVNYDNDLTIQSQNLQTVRQSQLNNTSFQNEMKDYDQTVKSDYQNTQIQNPKQNNSSLSDYEKTVQSQLFETKPKQQTINRQQIQLNDQQMSVTQQYADEEFEEYLSDEEEINQTRTEKSEVLQLYKDQLNQTFKKQQNILEEIHETSQESWTSSQAQSPTLQEKPSRIQSLRKIAISQFGPELFNQIYAFMTHHAQKKTSPNEMRQSLESIVGKQRLTECLIFDEILYLEAYQK